LAVPSSSNRSSIVVYGFSSSPVLGLIYRALAHRAKRKVYFIPQESFLQRVSLAVSLENSIFTGVFQLPDGTKLHESEILSFCFENHFVFVPASPEDNLKDVQYVRTEGWALLSAIAFGFTPNVLVVNPPPRVDVSQSRALAISFLQSCGIPAPPMLVTSDPKRAEAFYEEMNGSVIYKHVKQPDSAFRRMTPEDLQRMARIANCPVHLEHFSAGKAVRIVVVGNQSFAFKEEYQQGGIFQLLPFKTDHEILKKCVDSVKSLGLVVAEIYLLQKEDGSWQGRGIYPFVSYPSLIFSHEEGSFPVREAFLDLLEQGVLA
jgi:hypothetical protein